MLGKALEAGVFGDARERELEDARRQLEDAEAQEMAAVQGAQKSNDVTVTSQAKLAADVTAPPAPAGGKENVKALSEEPPRPPSQRDIQLTAALAGELIDELAEAYRAKWFQERVRKCARDSGYESSIFQMRLQDVALKVQKPILTKWGFEGNENGRRDMIAAIKEHSGGDGMLRRKYLRCLELLYGGQEAGMLDILRIA